MSCYLTPDFDFTLSGFPCLGVYCCTDPRYQYEHLSMAPATEVVTVLSSDTLGICDFRADIAPTPCNYNLLFTG